MNIKDQHGTGDDGGFSALFRSWRYFFWFLALVLLIAGFYAEENWRGRRDLENYNRELHARGQTVAVSAFVPEPVADSENFALTPLLGPLYDFLPGTQKWRDTNALQRANGIAPLHDAVRRAMKEAKQARSNSWVKANLDLVAWHQAFLPKEEPDRAKTNSRANEATLTNATALPAAEKDRTSLSAPYSTATMQEAARGILAGLSECNTTIEQIRTDSHRRFSRFNLRYQEDNPAAILLPHLSVLKRLTEILQLRAAAGLALGRTEESFNDLQLMLYLTDASKQEPIFISQLVRMGQMQLALEAMANGMRQWSEPQLRELQSRLGQFNFCADVKHALEAERAVFGGGVIDFLRHSPDKYNALASNESMLPTALFVAMPSGWFDFEKLNYFRLSERYLESGAIDLRNGRINPQSVEHAGERIATILAKSPGALFLQHRFFARILLPSLAGVFRKTAFAQQGVDAASIACALERHRRARGEFPEALDELIPQFAEKLPADIITGQPLHYRRVAAGQYLVYSVGWNEKDDGGTVAAGKKEENNAPVEGDWVWRGE